MPGDAASSLSIHLLGPFEARLPDGSLPRLRSRKEQWLLALLILQLGRPRERAWLAGMLWPDSSQTQALANLRNCLAGLRHALGPEARRLSAPTPRALTLDLNGAEVDVLAFDAAIARGDQPSLARAVVLYRGALLEECSEAWALQERQLREQAFLPSVRYASSGRRSGCAKRWVRPCHRQSAPSTTVPPLPSAPSWARRLSPPRGRRGGRCRWTTRSPLRSRGRRR
jgi:two-component SAPR family response regulator